MIIAEFKPINAGWAGETIVSDNEFIFCNCKKYIVLRASKICWDTCFHLYSPNIKVLTGVFSRQHFKKIS